LNDFNQLSIWVSFQLSIIFLIGIPVTLSFWSFKKRNKAVIKLLSIYWKESLLFFISLLLLIGKYNYALVITNISTLLMTVSVWFWNDINDELREYDFSYSLTTITKIWRWTITIISLNFFIQSLQNFNCFSFINSDACVMWLQPSSDLYIIIKNLFIFFIFLNKTVENSMWFPCIFRFSCNNLFARIYWVFPWYSYYRNSPLPYTDRWSNCGYRIFCSNYRIHLSLCYG